MFDYSPEEYSAAVAYTKKEYPLSTIHHSLAFILCKKISTWYDHLGRKDGCFGEALRSALTECRLYNEEREWYKAFAGHLFGKRGASVKQRRNTRAQKQRHRSTRTTRSRSSSEEMYYFEIGVPQGLFFFIKELTSRST